MKRYFVLVATFLVVSIVAVWGWVSFGAPYITRIPDNFSYKAEQKAIDNIGGALDPTLGEIPNKATLTYDVVAVAGNILTIKGTFEDRKPDGSLIFGSEQLYGVNALTGQHVVGVGSSDRTGYFFAPKFLKEGQPFTYWYVNLDKPANMKFLGKEIMEGLEVYKYQTDYEKYAQDQTAFMGFVPGVPEKYGIKLETINTVWIEPVSGYMVAESDWSTDYYFYDIKTGQKVKSYNAFKDVYTDESIDQNVAKAQELKNQALFVYRTIPMIGVSVLVVIFIAIGLMMKKKMSAPVV
jgi:hypothetical protein